MLSYLFLTLNKFAVCFNNHLSVLTPVTEHINDSVCFSLQSVYDLIFVGAAIVVVVVARNTLLAYVCVCRQCGCQNCAHPATLAADVDRCFSGQSANFCLPAKFNLSTWVDKT